MQYNKDYELSRQKELEFEKHLQVKYSCLTETTDSSEYFPYWDISTTATCHNNKVTTFEVKVQNTYQHGKVVIEACRIVDEVKHPSGLSITTANYYIICFAGDDNFYLIATDTLKQLVASSKALHKEIYIDKNGYQLHYFNKQYFMQFCKVI